MATILFEDNDMLVVDKPEGLATIPERHQDKDCLLAMLTRNMENKLFVVHRLDKEVSGVILFAKHATAHKRLNDQFAKRSVHKTYLALTHGLIEKDKDTIEKPIRLFGSGRMGIDWKTGKPCTTKFQVINRFRNTTLVHIHPITGRRHQIRVHFYSIGHAIVGDLRYGDSIIQKTFPRLMLHAQSIRLIHPLSGKRMTIEAQIPDSFQALIERMMET